MISNLDKWQFHTDTITNNFYIISSIYRICYRMKYDVKYDNKYTNKFQSGKSTWKVANPHGVTRVH